MAEAARPKVIVLGSGVPEEIIHAAGVTPYWILGGSLGTANWADDAVPRDTDPVCRSILGFLVGDLEPIAEDALILVPVTSDSNRKLAYLLKQAGKKVHTLDFPPVKDTFSRQKWLRQLERCAEAFSAHTRRRITKRSLRQAYTTVSHSRMLMQQFIGLTEQKKDRLGGDFRMMILQSYYWADDIDKWNTQLARLNQELKLYFGRSAPRSKGNVLLMGSPVYFPNYKIPFLLQDVGLHISAHADGTIQKIFQAPSSSLEELALNFYHNDCSGAYSQNESLRRHVAALVAARQLDGVVYHVLKGQIEYDFELDWFEKLFAEQGIPIFRLETDYKYQDIEQLRIRMEAFMEVLQHRTYQKKDVAV
jgi:benzoyl-CoA reductase/2-hydroxyglutaryl-CoA dehydratase subunit BcrC/BadD/HgdB